MHMEKSSAVLPGSEQEAKLRESFKRCSPETMDAILRFRNERDLDAVIVAVHGIIERYVKLEPGQHLLQRPDSTRLGEDQPRKRLAPVSGYSAK